MNLRDKKILVTGSSSGIGKAIAIECAKQGGVVVIHFRNNKKGALETLKSVEKYSKGMIVSADLSLNPEVEELFERLGDEGHADLDVLVNNAGEATSGELGELEVWENQWRNIFMSQVYVANAFIENSKSKNIRKIVNISSVYGIPETASPDFPQYSAAKSAVNNFTCSLAKKLAPLILVNAVAPGYTLTPAWEGTSKEELKECKSLTKIKRFTESSEIATIVTALLQNDSMTGEIIRVDGGLHLLNIS